jgi:hypothetical protein
MRSKIQTHACTYYMQWHYWPKIENVNDNQMFYGNRCPKTNSTPSEINI